MSIIERQLFVMCLMYVCVWFDLRTTLGAIEEVNLSKKTIKERRKGQSIKEWFFCTRFRDVIPGFVFPIYYIILIVNTVFLIIIIGIFFKGEIREENWALIRNAAIFNACYWFTYWAASFDPKYHNLREELWVPNIKTGKTAKRRKYRIK